jgi:hypothetical protein
MKKTTKKLVLAKETVRRLEEADLTRVAGNDDPLLTGMSCRFCLDEPLGPP